MWDRGNKYQAVSNAFLMRDGQTFGYYVWVIKIYVICVRLRTQPKNFEKLKYKKSKFLVYGIMLVIQFPYMKKNTNHRPFMQFSARMELHGKCMTSIFPNMEIVWLVFLVIPGIYIYIYIYIYIHMIIWPIFYSKKKFSKIKPETVNQMYSMFLNFYRKVI